MDMDPPPYREESGVPVSLPHNDEGLIVTGDCEWIRDDFPLWGPAANELSVQKRQLIEWVIARRCVVTDGVAYYLYCTSIAAWAQLESKPASDELVDAVDVFAPVNFEQALTRYYPIIKRVSYPIGPVLRSVCIGTWRLTFTIEFKDRGPHLHFSPHPSVVGNVRGDEHARMYMFVLMPISLPHPYACPVNIMVDMMDKVINEILRPLRDDQKIDFLWRIGKALQDTGMWPSVILFYGANGHEGKGTLSTMITRLFPDSTLWMSDDLIGKMSKWPQEDVVMSLCSKRILVCDECQVEDGFSYNNIKRWTSNSPVSSGGKTAILRQTIIGLSNKAPFYERSAINNSIGRRLVIYHMKKIMKRGAEVPSHMITNAVRLKFMSLCLCVAASYDEPCPSLAICLYTLFRKNVNKITAGTMYDVAATTDQMIAATTMMAVRCGLSSEKLCSAFSAMSPDSVGQSKYGTLYVRSIRPRNVSLTQYGYDVLLQSRARTTVDLETLKETVKIM